MGIKEFITENNMPDVKLSEMAASDLKQKRLLARLETCGINSIGDLSKMTDDEIIDLPLFGKKKIVKLQEFLEDWCNKGYPLNGKINSALNPELLIESLKRKVFYRDVNMQILALRCDYHTFESAGEPFGKSRQGVQYIEKLTYQKFKSWYAENHIREKIGDYDEFQFYCEQNYAGRYETELKAIKKLVRMAKYKYKD